MEYLSEASFGALSRASSPKARNLPFSPAVSGILLAATDFAIIIIASAASGSLYHTAVFGSFGKSSVFLGAGLIIAATFTALVYNGNGYNPQNISSRRTYLRPLLGFWCASFALLATVLFLMKVGETLSRGYFLTFFFLGGGAVIGIHHALRLTLSHSLRRHIPRGPRALLIADMTSVSNAHMITGLQRVGYNFDGVFAFPEISSSMTLQDNRADLEQIRAYVRKSKIEEILILADWGKLGKISALLDALRVLPLPVRLVADQRYGDLLSKPVAKIGNTIAVEIHRGPLTRLERAFKRSLDLTLASAALVALMPLLILVALAIKIDSKGPVFFQQSRVGFSGRVFRIYKFRSMVTMDDGDEVLQATKHDARVTRVGRFLRSSSIDELPQLLNVLNGDMSLVGPRPHALAHDTKYDEIIHDYAFRHHVKPGITGWAQISGFRGETPTVDLMEKRIEHDLDYINRWSLFFDIKIIFLTAIKVLRHRAY